MAMKRKRGQASFRKADSFLDLDEALYRGPSSSHELHTFPDIYVQRLVNAKPDSLRRLLTNYNAITFFSHYSGMNADYIALLHGGEALQRAGHHVEPICYKHSCDVSKAALAVLVKMDPGPQHVFRDMNARLSLAVQAHIAHELPPPEAEPEQAKEAYKIVASIHKEYFERQFAEDATAHCVRHNAECCLYEDKGPSATLPFAENVFSLRKFGKS